LQATQNIKDEVSSIEVHENELKGIGKKKI
jgi:hypothetical protein